jgi:hypothetical protein
MSNWHVDARDYSLWNIIHLRCNAFRKSISFSGLRRTGLISFLWLQQAQMVQKDFIWVPLSPNTKADQYNMNKLLAFKT